MTSTSSADDKSVAGDSIPPKCAVIEVHVGELKQLFDAIDPSPFRDRDLDPKAVEFIVGWAKDLPREASLALVVNLDRESGLPDEAVVLRDAIHEFFRHRAETQRQRLRELFRVGRTSLVIGLVALAAAIALGDFLATLLSGRRIAGIVRESLTIGGWVSMWRPLGVFLYDWWPTRNEARLSDRLAVMPIRIRYANAIFVRTGGFNTSVVVGVARYGQAVIDPHGECATIQYPDEDQVYVVLEGSGSVQYDLMFIGDSVGFNPGG